MQTKPTRRRARKWLGASVILVVAGGITYALQNEWRRERAAVERAFSGVVQVGDALNAAGVDIRKTDRLVLWVVADGVPLARRSDTPFVPPQAFRIGTDDSLAGARWSHDSYTLIAITDRDGDPLRPVPGEYYGRTPLPLRLGQREITLSLQEGFRGGLFNASHRATR